jgi:hypothetical protein
MVMSSKLDIQSEMAAFDLKDRDYYKNFTDEDRKKFSNYLMISWGVTVEGSSELQEFYIISTNERLNKHFFAVNKHPELQWLMATTVSPGLGKQRHPWLAQKKKEGGGSNKGEKFLMKLYPSLKADDVKLMSQFTDVKELKKLAEAMGWTKEQIKKELG